MTLDAVGEGPQTADAQGDGETPAAARSYSVEQVESIAKKRFEGAPGSHDWTHTLRVCRLCERIAESETADVEVLRIAALLHDIGRRDQDEASGSVCHAERGVQIAAGIIDNLPLSDAQKKNILHCIGTHRFRGKNPPKTIEAKILFDADKLDSIGAVGVGRAFLFAGEVGAMLHNPNNNIENTLSYSRDDTGFREYQLKLRKIRDRTLTRQGRMLADERHRFMERFFERFIEEYQGKG